MTNVRSVMPAFTRHLPCGTCCCWWNWDELEAVYQWLYSREPELVRRAIGRVAAWKARDSVPLMIEVTADLMECQLWEAEHRHDDTTDQALSLLYSMAITRFVNGVRDECVSVSRTTIRDILSVVIKVGIPSWIVTLRHLGTHQYLPSLASFRAGAEFALSWLDAHYWKPQLQLKPVRTHGASSASRGQESQTQSTAEPVPKGSGRNDEQADRHTDIQADTQTNNPNEAAQHSVEKPDGDVIVIQDSPQLVLTQKDLNLFTGSRQYVQKLQSKPQLARAIAEASCSTLIDYVKEGLILAFSPPLNYDILVPDITDLASFPQLRFHQKRKPSSFSLWHGHALGMACKKETSTKQRLVAALVMAMHETECSPKTRDFLGAWLKLFLEEQSEIGTEQVGRVEVIAARRQALLGIVDWKKLLEVTKTHPGYYSYALIKIILDHIGATLPKKTVEKLTYATTLLTLSERIGILEFTGGQRSTGTGKYMEKIEQLLKAAKKKVGGVTDSTRIGREGEGRRKRSASLQGKSRAEQSGDSKERSVGSQKGEDSEIPLAKRPRLQDKEVPGEAGGINGERASGSREREDSEAKRQGVQDEVVGSGEQPSSDDEGVLIVGVTKGKKKLRWNTVSDFESWVRCPLGLCPGQEFTPTLLDLPAEVDRASDGTTPPVDYLQYIRCATGEEVGQISSSNDIMDQTSPKEIEATGSHDHDREISMFTDAEIENIQRNIALL